MHDAAALRRVLIARLGQTSFQRAHARLSGVTDILTVADDKVLAADIQSLLGREWLMLLPLVLKLISLEGQLTQNEESDSTMRTDVRKPQKQNKGSSASGDVQRLEHSLAAKIDSASTNECCVICTEDLPPCHLCGAAVDACPNGHRFHAHCISQWEHELRNSRRRALSCPTCRAPMRNPSFPMRQRSPTLGEHARRPTEQEDRPGRQRATARRMMQAAPQPQLPPPPSRLPPPVEHRLQAQRLGQQISAMPDPEIVQRAWARNAHGRLFRQIHSHVHATPGHLQPATPATPRSAPVSARRDDAATMAVTDNAALPPPPRPETARERQYRELHGSNPLQWA